jgi:3,4-dihydroxy 2-butanone 4-phosphate synthase/GTP cyclohydrolase II
MQHLAVVFGDIRDGAKIPVRLYTESVADDVFGARCPVHAYMKRISEIGRGVIVYLREGSVGVGHQNGGRAMLGQHDSHAEARQRESEWLEIGLGAQILKDLGITSIRLMSSRERHYVGLEGFGITIAETEIVDA